MADSGGGTLAALPGVGSAAGKAVGEEGDSTGAGSAVTVGSVVD